MIAHRDGSPIELVTIEGFPYDASEEVLLIRTRMCRLIFDMRLPHAGARLRTALRAATVERLASESPERVRGDFLSIRAFIREAAAATGEPVMTLNMRDYGAFLAARAASKPHSVNGLLYSLRRTAPFVGGAMGRSLRDELPFIERIKRKPRPGNAHAPRDGCRALSKAQYADLAGELGRKLAADEITPEDFVLALLATTLVPRPAQVALLKVRDLVVDCRAGGRPSYRLRITRMKQRGRTAQSSFRLRPIHPELGSLLDAQGDRARRKALAEGLDPMDAALFPREVSTFVEEAGFPELPGFLRHSTASDIKRRLLVLGVVSRRSRRTVGTMMRASNRSYRQIGLVLDNTSRAARIYVDDTPEMIARTEAKLGSVLAPLANLFMGRPGGFVPSLKPESFRS